MVYRSTIISLRGVTTRENISGCISWLSAHVVQLNRDSLEVDGSHMTGLADLKKLSSTEFANLIRTYRRVGEDNSKYQNAEA